MWRAEKSPDAVGRLDNLKELVKALAEFENLQGFLEHVSLVMENETDEGAEKVSIMTLHAAKGLEFPAVFLPGWEDGLFPSQRSMDESGVKGLEEERRLAYVGITRARAALHRLLRRQPPRLQPVAVAAPLALRRRAARRPRRGADPARPLRRRLRRRRARHVPGRSNLADAAAKADVYNSPGWKRMQARAGERPVSQPREAKDMVIDATAAAAFETGTRVFHQKFGYGTVTEVEGDKLTIDFEKAGRKNVVARFVTAADAVPF